MWFNTRLNRAYTRVVQEAVTAEYGFSDLYPMYLVGDDSIAGLPDDYEGLRRLEAYNLCALQSQASKQLLDNEQAELTRLFYRSDGGIYGSLARAIGNGCSHDLQGSVVFAGPHMAAGLKAQIHMFQRRGADVEFCDAIMHTARLYWLQLVYDEDGVEVVRNIPLPICAASVATGGLGFVGIGKIPNDLLRPLSWPSDDALNEAHRLVSEQWQLRNPKVVAQGLATRSFAADVLLETDDVVRVLEAAVLDSNMPGGLKRNIMRAWHKECATALALYELEERKTSHPFAAERPRLQTEDERLLFNAIMAARQAVATLTETITNTRFGQPLQPWDSSWNLATDAISSALQTAASAPGVIKKGQTSTGVKLTPIELVARLTNRGSGTLLRLKEQAGAYANVFIDGTLSHPTIFGLIAPKHYVLVDFALETVLRVLQRDDRFTQATVYNLPRIRALMDMAALSIEDWLSKHAHWGKQQHY